MNQQDQLDLNDLQQQFYHKLKVQGKSINTLKNYKTDLDCFNNYLITNKKVLDINDFNISQVEEYGYFLDQKYSSDNSKRRRVQALRIFFDFLVENGLIPSNPVRKLPTSPKFLDIPRPTPFIAVKTLWEYLISEGQTTNKMNRLMNLRNQLLFLFIYGAGLKVSDIAKLKVDHIIKDSNDEDNQTYRILVNPPKRDPYSIPLPSIFGEVYFEYKALLDDMKKEVELEFDQILFNANPFRILSGGLSPRGIEIIFKDLKKKLMIELTPKSLRQACIFKWLCQDHKENLIKEWLGVAPSYSLKLYKDHLEKNVFSDEFIAAIYHNRDSKLIRN